nr:uncharacterized protein LOC117465580 [Pseudochaenichthys georgianus]
MSSTLSTQHSSDCTHRKLVCQSGSLLKSSHFLLIQLELQAAVVGDSAVTPSGPAASFDVSRHINLVPVFRESEVEVYFGAFERIAAALHWPEDVWAILLQCKLVGKAQAACSSLSVEDSLEYDKVKGAILRAYELVPEAYRQRFRGIKKAAGQTYVDFAREKKVLFDRWCRACKADDIASVCELMLLEEFKNCVPERTVVYLNEQKVTTLQQAATLADEFALIHRSVFFQRDPPQRDPPQRDTYRRAPDSYVPCASVPLLGPRIDRACYFCLDPGHMIADCAAWKRERAAGGKHPKGVGLIKTVCPSRQVTVKMGPDECFKPFISTAFVSLSGKVEDQRQVTMLRDSGGSQSFILASALPLSNESACDVSAVVDASGSGAGAVLLQEGDGGVSHPVCYFSTKFKRHQLNYSTIEKETLAMLLALQHFQVYVGSSSTPVVVYTDHNPLVFLSQMFNHNQRLMRWALLAQDFNIVINYKKGADNVVADVLSRG